jgi:hypothetical protein
VRAQVGLPAGVEAAVREHGEKASALAGLERIDYSPLDFVERFVEQNVPM